MERDLVLITGATGLIGFRTLLDLLLHGYRVRAVVRSEAKKQIILTNKALKTLDASIDLSFVVVSNIEVEGAYDEAVQDVDYVIHIASPVPNTKGWLIHFLCIGMEDSSDKAPRQNEHCL